MADAVNVPASLLPPARRRSFRPSGIGGWLVWGLVDLFFITLFALISTVVLDSFATTWFGSWLPDDFTIHWYGDAWAEFDLSSVLLVTAQVAIAVVAISALIGLSLIHISEPTRLGMISY